MKMSPSRSLPPTRLVSSHFDFVMFPADSAYQFSGAWLCRGSGTMTAEGEIVMGSVVFSRFFMPAMPKSNEMPVPNFRIGH